MTIFASTIESVIGGSNRLQKYLNQKKYSVKIMNNDNLCALYAIVIGMKFADKEFLKKKNNLTQIEQSELQILKSDINTLLRKGKLLVNKTETLVQKLNLANSPLGIPEIQKVEEFIKEYQIWILDDESFEWLYIGQNNREKKIILLYSKENEHFDLITGLPKFFGKDYYCYICKKAYMSYYNHPCNNVCKMCKKRTCTFNTKIKCSMCNRQCNSMKCLLDHQESNICNEMQICNICFRYKSKTHVCNNERWCSNCKSAVSMNHKCYILTQNERQQKKEEKFAGYIFFDYESMCVDISNLIVCDKICCQCLNDGECENCGIHYFYNNNSFCEWLLKQNNYTCLAHNLKGYDGVFIMKYLTENPIPSDPCPEVIMNGSKVNMIKFKGIRIIDSYNFIPMALSKFGKAFGIEELKKGYFPHKFNTPENQDYIGDFPDASFYAPEQMSTRNSVLFFEWYKNQRGIFNLQHELKTYCESDVNILKQGCLKFRDLVIKMTN